MTSTIEVYPPLPEGTVAPATLYLEGGVKVDILSFKDNKFLEFELPEGMDIGRAAELFTPAVGRPCFPLGSAPKILHALPVSLSQQPQPTKADVHVKKEIPKVKKTRIKPTQMVHEQDLADALETAPGIEDPLVEPVQEPNSEDTPIVQGPEAVWDRLFTKPDPVYGLSQWSSTRESTQYVYLPNDLTIGEDFAEESQSNAYYTEILVVAYTNMCKVHGIRPEIKLWDGTILDASAITPMDGCQHHIKGQVSARLANSVLVGFNDWRYRDAFLISLKALQGQYPYQSEAIYITVLAKCENILIGGSQHIPNQMFTQKICDYLDNLSSGNGTFVTAVTGVTRQMLQEGLVLQESRSIFEKRIASAGGIPSMAQALKAYDAGYLKGN
jgi:hypothetical protein